MIAVLDANIVVALFAQLPYSERAKAAVAKAQTAIAPDLVIHEVTNALWRLATAGQMSLDYCQKVLERIPALFDELVPGIDLAAGSLTDAVNLRHAAYDMFYARLAYERDATLITADQRLAAVMQSHPSKPSVVLV